MKGNDFFTDCIKNKTKQTTKNIAMHWDAYKFDMMIDTSKLYILVLEEVTLTLIRGQKGEWKVKVLHQLPYKVCN